MPVALGWQTRRIGTFWSPTEMQVWKTTGKLSPSSARAAAPAERLKPTRIESPSDEKFTEPCDVCAATPPRPRTKFALTSMPVSVRSQRSQSYMWTLTDSPSWGVSGGQVAGVTRAERFMPVASYQVMRTCDTE